MLGIALFHSVRGPAMRMSDEEYFRSCVARERHLAQLLGYEVEEYYESAGTLWVNTEPLPQWTRDWRACGPLLSRYGVTLAYTEDEHGEAVTAGTMLVHFSDHPSRDRAVMFAIVKAVIHLLEHDKSHKGEHHYSPVPRGPHH